MLSSCLPACLPVSLCVCYMFAQANIKCLMFQSLACPQSQSEFQSAMPIIAAATVNRDHFGKLPKPKQQQQQQHHRQQKQKHLQLACLTKSSSPSPSSDNTLVSLHLWGERACVLRPYCTFPQCTGAGSTTTFSSFDNSRLIIFIIFITTLERSWG